MRGRKRKLPADYIPDPWIPSSDEELHAQHAEHVQHTEDIHEGQRQPQEDQDLAPEHQLLFVALQNEILDQPQDEVMEFDPEPPYPEELVNDGTGPFLELDDDDNPDQEYDFVNEDQLDDDEDDRQEDNDDDDSLPDDQLDDDGKLNSLL